jgi:hypothetical protein
MAKGMCQHRHPWRQFNRSLPSIPNTFHGLPSPTKGEGGLYKSFNLPAFILKLTFRIGVLTVIIVGVLGVKMSSTEDLEKGLSSPPNETHHNHLGHNEHHHVHIPHHPGKRLKEFLRPDGKRVHIAHTPEEESKLRHHLSISEPNDDFDVLIHGSPEHVSIMAPNGSRTCRH